MNTGLVFGLDLGIGSCGWAALRLSGEEEGAVLGMGTRTFDVPETAKTRTPTNQLRRQHRGMRRVLNRRRQRMNDVRDLFQRAGLLPEAHKHALAVPGSDPWTLRHQGLDRPLVGWELAVALGHIAKHRGFQSNSKRDRGRNTPDDTSKMLGAIEETRSRLARWRSVAEMAAHDPEFSSRKRNRDGDYSRSLLRRDLVDEVRVLFQAQRRLGNTLATPALEEDFIGTAFFQRPLQDSEDKVGPCPFEAGERRTARHAPSFELFRLLSRLAALRVREGKAERPLTPAEVGMAVADFGSSRSLSFKRLRTLLELPASAGFDGVPVAEETKRDVVARSGEATPGAYVWRTKVLGETGWASLWHTPSTLDRLSEIITFREDMDRIASGIAELDLPPLIHDTILDAVKDGQFASFKGAGHISAKACRAMAPHLVQGMVYSAAAAAAGYTHTDRAEGDLDDIANPIARKAVTEALKQVRALVEEYGRPEYIHVELAREVGKSAEERDQISRGIEKRNNAKEKLRERFREDTGREPHGDDMLRYELWLEQGTFCVYSNQPIPLTALISGDNAIQVDHILPWSRFGDDSFVNKTLCYAKANQDKKGRTPHEWLVRDLRDDARWETLRRAVEGAKGMKGVKKRNYLLKDAEAVEQKFRTRNLSDTRYASRVLLHLLKQAYGQRGRDTILARPGPLTDRLRRAWGVQALKKRLDDGTRLDDDRHHALDALIVAATSQSALQRLTRAFQDAEVRGDHRDFYGFPPPWPGFIEEAKNHYTRIVVSRAERHRARGEAHGATIRQVVEEEEGAVVYERRAVADLTLKDLERLKDPERNGAIVEALRAWIDAGKPVDAPPRSPKGDMLGKVRLRTKKNVDVPVRGGAADRGEIARLDVFRKLNRRDAWEYYLVPVYPHQIFGPEGDAGPPMRAILANKDEGVWPIMDPAAGYEFLWSLNPFSWVEIEKADGTFIDGYYRSVDRSVAAIAVSPHQSKLAMTRGIGVKSLTTFRKFAVDRLGRRFEVTREVRTWRGGACT
ncbi:type II CRISPR RNA-guided endonuclease Cas9 [Nitrospirillum iridis]|uniref:CRISPR-associated endonuclease Cas9 n=1 Tax=Nitrospirillum iridis TaxID=765888 RepID=A0A7X0B1Z5_9PROT|nr:type II CRISPR RNA-guided endonuclease Cas9 [Nitrospirillum iridis]MBB6252906.1 CRISPR-associated endonuclease Csn1 [Nitrospirillum iridis]